MIILGIDPGLSLTGYGLIEFQRQPKLLDGGVIRLNAKTSLAQRLAELDEELAALFDEANPDICAVEQLYANYKHPRTAILMAHARGVILLAAQRRGVKVEQISANRIKKSLIGFGHAGKLQMQKAIQREFKLPNLPEPPDVADALAVALCCGRQISGTMKR
jgi:crossover junction endodeoxyribonuclease RuvC